MTGAYPLEDVPIFRNVPSSQLEPLLLLILILSCIAALQAPVIMMSQNRQAAKDRLQVDQDFQVNIRAEFAIQQLHRKLDEMRAGQIQHRHAEAERWRKSEVVRSAPG